MSCGYTTAIKYFLWEYLPLLKYVLQKTMGIIATSRLLHILQAVRLPCRFCMNVDNILVEKSICKNQYDPKWRPVIQCIFVVPSANLKNTFFLTMFLCNTVPFFVVLFLLFWPSRYIIKFNMQSLHVVRNNAMQLYQLGANSRKNSFAEKDLRVLLHKNLNTIQQSVLTAKTIHLLGFTIRSTARRFREVILLYLTSILRSHLK